MKEGRVAFRLDGAESGDVLVLRRPPTFVQSALFGLLRPIARARGYRGTYPQYGRSLLRAGEVR